MKTIKAALWEFEMKKRLIGDILFEYRLTSYDGYTYIKI